MLYKITLKTGTASYNHDLVNEWIKTHGGRLTADWETRRSQLQAFVDEQHTIAGIPLVKVIDWETEG